MRTWARPAVFLVSAVVLGLAVVAGLMVWNRFFAPPDRSAVLAALATASDSLHAPGRTIEAAAAALETATAASQFVAAEIGEAQYTGALFAPEDVLALRTGNRTDKARLLAALINAQGGSVAVVAADGGADAPDVPDELPGLPPAYAALIDLLRIDRAAIADKRLAALTGIAAARTAEVDAADSLISARFGGGPAPEIPSPAPTVLAGVAGTDATGAPVGDASAELLDIVPGDLTIRIVGLGGDGGRRVLLEHTGPIAIESAISFQPLVAPPEAFGRELDPASVAAWAPVLAINGDVVSGRPFTPAGLVPPSADGGAPPYGIEDVESPAEDVPAIGKLVLHDLNAEGWPQMRIALSAELPAGAIWSPDIIRLTDGDTPLRPRLIGFPALEQRAVMLLIDASASMADGARVFSAQRIAQGILAALPDGTMLAVASLAGAELRVTLAPAALSSSRDAAAEAIDAAFVLDTALSLSSGIEAALAVIGAPADIVLIGDGVADEDAPGEIASRLSASDSRFFGISIDTAPDRYSAFGTGFRWNSGDEPAPVIASLLRVRSPFVELGWTAPAGTPQETRTVRVAPSKGSAGGVETSYIVPATDVPPPPSDVEQLLLEVTVPGRDGPVRLARELMQLGPEHSPWQLEMQARLVVSPGPSPDATIIGSSLDAWLDLAAAQTAAIEGTALPPTRARPSFPSLQRIAGLWGLAELAAGGPLAQSDPVVLLERLDFSLEEGADAQLVRTIDVLHDGLLVPDSARARWVGGLALGAAEAALIEGSSVGADLLAATDLVMIGPTDGMPAWANAELQELARMPDFRLALAESTPRAAWVIQPDQRLSSRLFNPPSKGSSAVETAAFFNQLRSRLELISIFSGAAGSVAGMSGIPHGGVIGILDVNLKMWCFSSVMMGYVGDAIAGLPTPGDGDPEEWRREAQRLCQLADVDGLARAYAAALGSGLISGYAGDVLTGLSERALSQAVGRALGGGGSFGLAAFWNSVLSLSGVGPALNEVIDPPQG